MTISTSSAPFLIASAASKALTVDVLAPKGKPITVQTLTSVAANFSAAKLTQVGLIQTLMKSYWIASSMICCTFALGVSAFNTV